MRVGHFEKRLLIPYLIGSVPLSYLGGTLVIDQLLFEWLIFLSLLIAGLLLIWQHKVFDDPYVNYRPPSLHLAILVGAILGLISGIIGIGGGIFLVLAVFKYLLLRIMVLITGFLVLFVSLRMGVKVTGFLV